MVGSNGARLPSKHWNADTPVPLLKGALKQHPRFSDGIWFVGIRENQIRRDGTIDFDAMFPDPAQHLTARELAMLGLLGKTSGSWKTPGNKPLSVTTIRKHLYRLRNFYDFLAGRGLKDLSQVDNDIIRDFRRSLRDKDTELQSGYFTMLRLLQGSSAFLTAAAMDCDPLVLRSPKVGNRGVENKTPRIPENVIQPLFVWAKYYVEHFASDIITACYLSEIGQRAHVGKRKNSKGLLGLVARERLSALALAHFGETLPLSETEDASHFGALADARLAQIELGKAAKQSPDAIRKTARKLVTPPGAKRSWRAAFTPDDMALESRNLIAACYIICSYLSGMRDSEVLAMRLNCLHEWCDESGEVIRRYVISKEYKGNGGEGLTRAWVTIEPVATAIRVMAQIGHFERIEAGSDQLFVMAHHTRKKSSPSLKSNANRYIADFIEHINSRLVPRHKSAAFPQIPVTSFRPLTSRMFRRTIAWFIANKPFGIVAGMIQFGHLGVHMMEGYAGTSASGFKQELENERGLARVADIRATYERHVEGEKVAGPIADELRTEFDEVSSELTKIKGRLATRDDVDALLKHRAIQLWPGLLNDCFYDESRALCKPAGEEARQPIPLGNQCNPHECKNSCFQKKHLAPWENLVSEIDRRSRSNSTPQIQRDIQAYQRSKFMRVINSIKEAGGKGA